MPCSAVGHAVTAEFFEGGSVKTLKDDGGQRTEPSPKAKWVWSSQWLEAGWKWWAALCLTIASILGSVPAPEVACGWVGRPTFGKTSRQLGPPLRERLHQIASCGHLDSVANISVVAKKRCVRDSPRRHPSRVIAFWQGRPPTCTSRPTSCSSTNFLAHRAGGPGASRTNGAPPPLPNSTA